MPRYDVCIAVVKEYFGQKQVLKPTIEEMEFRQTLMRNAEKFFDDLVEKPLFGKRTVNKDQYLKIFERAMYETLKVLRVKAIVRVK